MLTKVVEAANTPVGIGAFLLLLLLVLAYLRERRKARHETERLERELAEARRQTAVSGQ